jgi:hypothetical protein
MEIERGSDVFIPKELSVKNFSLSYRFYDPIFHIVEDFIDKEKKMIYNLKTRYSLKSLEEQD